MPTNETGTNKPLSDCRTDTEILVAGDEGEILEADDGE